MAPRDVRGAGASKCRRIWLVLLILLALLQGMAYALLTPPWQAPDEPQHMQYILLVMEGVRELTPHTAHANEKLVERVHSSLIEQRFWFFRAHDVPPSEPQYFAAYHHPPLYYLTASLILAPLRTADLRLQLYGVRFLSVLLSTSALLVTWGMARRLFPEDPLVVFTTTAFAALLPMHSFIGASVNNDVLAELIGSLAILLCVDLGMRGASLPRLLALALVNVLAFLTKRTLLFVLPLSILVCIWALVRWLKERCSRSQILAGLLLTLLLLGILQDKGVGLARLIGGESRSWSFRGWVLARRAPHRVFLPYVADESLPPPTLLERGAAWVLRRISVWTARDRTLLAASENALTVRALISHLGITFASFWGNFGWLNVPLSLGWYLLLVVAVALSFLGLILLTARLARGRRRWAASRWRGFIVVLVAAGLCLTQLLLPMVARGKPQQARYLLPALPAFALLLVLGWLNVVPSRWRRSIAYFILLGFVVLNSVSLFHTLIPFYYG